MKNGEIEEGKMTLRAKIDLASGNFNMRDPVLYRIKYINHHRQGNKWCIFPMYDFAHPIEDALEGITHSLCSLEYEAHRPLYNWVVDECGFEKNPRQIEFARLNITNTIMSKRYLKKLVDEQFVESWDDPRMPTLVGLRRRGYTPEAIKKFIHDAFEEVGIETSFDEYELVNETYNFSDKPYDFSYVKFVDDKDDIESYINHGYDTKLFVKKIGIILTIIFMK